MTLEVNRLDASYGRLGIITKAAFTADPRSMLVLLGPNGAGKSTLMGAIAGLVVSKGVIRIDRHDIDHLPAHERARQGVALVPEGRRNLFPSMSVFDNLALGLALSPARDRRQRLETVMDIFPVLSSRRQQQAGMLSGGEQQMLAIAVALTHGPRLLMLDEPTQGLAPIALDGLADSFTALRKLGLTIVLAEQNIDFARRIADRYAFLKQGHLGDVGEVGELDDTRRVAEMFL